MNKKNTDSEKGLPSPNLKAVWEFFSPLFKTLGWRIWGLLTLTFVISLYGIGLKKVEGWAIDLLTLQPDGCWVTLAWIAIGIMVVQSLKSTVAHLANYDLSSRLGWMLRKFKNDICHRVERAVPEIFLVLTVESVRGRIKEVSDIRDFIRRIPYYLCRLVTGILAAIFATKVHPVFLALIAVDFTLAYVQMKNYIPVEMKLDKFHKGCNDEVNQTIKDSFDRIEEVHTSGAFEAVKERIDLTSRWSQKSRNFEVWANTVFGIKMDIQTAVTKGLFYLIGFYQVLYSGMTVGEFYTLLMFRGYIDDMESSILDFIGYDLPQTATTVQRVHEVLDLGERKYGEISIKPEEVKTLEVKDLKYGYKNPETDEKTLVLTGIDFYANRGEVIAIVGGSGSGKTTAIRCILNLRSDWEGDVLVNGVSIRDLSEDCLPGIFSLVSVRNVPMTGTFLDQFQSSIDIRNFDWEFMRECCRIAEILDFIESLPKGFKTNIGEKGLRLSDGQKQRINLAVSLMQRAVILIMDEATSALDPETQLKVMNNLKQSEYFKDRIILNITHRLAITTNANRIYVMGNGGKIVKSGTHKELIESCPEYLKMVKAEVGEL